MIKIMSQIDFITAYVSGLQNLSEVKMLKVYSPQKSEKLYWLKVTHSTGV